MIHSKPGPFSLGSLKIAGPTGDLHFQGNDEATFPQVDRHPRGVQNNEGCHDLVAPRLVYVGPCLKHRTYWIVKVNKNSFIFNKNIKYLVGIGFV